jgi:hypothetical protein
VEFRDRQRLRLSGDHRARPPGLWFTKWFARRIAYASQIDAGINRTLVGVQQLLVPPSVLGRPGFVLRVLRQARRRLRQP